MSISVFLNITKISLNITSHKHLPIASAWHKYIWIVARNRKLAMPVRLSSKQWMISTETALMFYWLYYNTSSLGGQQKSAWILECHCQWRKQFVLQAAVWWKHVRLHLHMKWTCPLFFIEEYNGNSYSHEHREPQQCLLYYTDRFTSLCAGDYVSYTTQIVSRPSVLETCRSKQLITEMLISESMNPPPLAWLSTAL